VDYRDLKALMSYGLCKGGTLDAAAIIHDGAIICKEELRFDNEIVRHKILDLVGDLYLSGARVRGNVVAIKPGHPANVGLAKLIIEDMVNHQ
jgi:UDP-3-O-acyl-N-acetylglucosamine deacetylase